MENNVSPLQDIEYRISISRLSNDKQNKLREMLSTITIKDIRLGGLELIFDREQERNNINAYTIKSMLMDFLLLLTKEDVRKHISPNADYAEITRELISFFDHFDCHDFDVLRTIEDLADYGEKTTGHPASWLTVDDEYDRIFRKEVYHES